jgi:hypothetical protein
LHSRGCRTDDGDNGSLLSDQDLHQAILKLIVGFYMEAFDRLPRASENMTELIDLLDDGGLCLGLLDPVSNIILNILALLPYAAASSSAPPAAKRSKREGPSQE